MTAATLAVANAVYVAITPFIVTLVPAWLHDAEDWARRLRGQR